MWGVCGSLCQLIVQRFSNSVSVSVFIQLLIDLVSKQQNPKCSQNVPLYRQIDHVLQFLDANRTMFGCRVKLIAVLLPQFLRVAINHRIIQNTLLKIHPSRIITGEGILNLLKMVFHIGWRTPVR